MRRPFACMRRPLIFLHLILMLNLPRLRLRLRLRPPCARGLSVSRFCFHIHARTRTLPTIPNTTSTPLRPTPQALHPEPFRTQHDFTRTGPYYSVSSTSRKCSAMVHPLTQCGSVSFICSVNSPLSVSSTKESSGPSLVLALHVVRPALTRTGSAATRRPTPY